MIAPHELTDGYEKNPIISMQTLRADFNGAILQFLIGLYQVALGSNSEIVWSRYFRNPPSPEIVKDFFLPLNICIYTVRPRS
jgi:CRISPR system Cascade subunit CasA